MYMATSVAREYGKTIYCRESTFVYDDDKTNKTFEECMNKR